MMKIVVVSLALLPAAMSLAWAQDRTIIKERPAVTIPGPRVTIEKRRPPVVEKRSVETTGRGGCDSKTVRKEGPEGSTTIKKERCD
jgi:hypothetical protein